MMDDPLADARMERYNQVSSNYRNLKRVDINSRTSAPRRRSNEQQRPSSTQRYSRQNDEPVVDPYMSTAQTPRRSSFGGTSNEWTLNQRYHSSSHQSTDRNSDERYQPSPYQSAYRNNVDRYHPSSHQHTHRNDDNNSVGVMSADSSLALYQDDISSGSPNNYHADHYRTGNRDARSVSSRGSSRAHPSVQNQTRPNTQSPELVTGENSHLQYLIDKGFPLGLARGVAENVLMFEHRLWLVDNSGSMQIGDGHRILHDGNGNFKKATRGSRWQEIQDTVQYHATMAIGMNSATTFRLLNDPGVDVGEQELSVAMNHSQSPEEELLNLHETMSRIVPGGVTPLTRHIWEIQQIISDKAPSLRREGKKVVLVIATDGLPTDSEGYGGEAITDEFLRAVKSLEDLPIWLVFRLCTDEQQVTKFYNGLDSELELSLEVIDDFLGEAQEVYRYNKWLNYCLPMHRVRELGYHDRLFDLIDERPLTKGEIRDFCCLIFGVENMPDPASDWIGFLKCLRKILKTQKTHWNPIKKKKKAWISLTALNQTYGDGNSCTIS